MNWTILNSTDRTHRTPTIAAFLALVVGLVAVALVGGGAAAAEPVNSTVDVDNDTGSVYVETTFASGITDENATADVVVTDPTGAEFANETIAGNASETVVTEWDVNDSDPDGNYSIVVTADSGVVPLGNVGTFDEGVSGGGGGGAGDSSDGWGSIMGLPVWLVSIGGVAIVAVVGKREGWWEDLR